jgi:molybdopterin-guanine dinucleotide biosynthesis protein A
VKGLLLCGGIGNRFQPLQEDKFLLSFLGKAATAVTYGGVG